MRRLLSKPELSNNLKLLSLHLNRLMAGSKRQYSESGLNKETETISENNDLNADMVHSTIIPPSTPSQISRKSHKFAMLLMYNGQNYYGMQINKPLPTIEEDLLACMLKIGLIDEKMCDQPQLFWFQRASKTDKNVSALGQVCSMNLKRSDSGGIVSKLNEHLPSSIVVLDLIRVTKHFNCKLQASDRIYQYMCPTFAFAPSQYAATSLDTSGAEQRWSHLRKYRMSAEQLERVNSLLSVFQGTHNFHNFTSGRLAKDKSCNRFLHHLEASQPVVLNDREFFTISIRGQSFMLHQIRKIIGLVIAICRGLVSIECLSVCFQEAKFNVPRAPGLGLMLKAVQYLFYNSKFASQGSTHQAIDFANYKEQIEAFEQTLRCQIMQVEEQENSMLLWLDKLVIHNFAPPDCQESSSSPCAVESSSFEVSLCAASEL